MGDIVMYNKVIISGINTADLIVLREEEKIALLKEIRETGSKQARDKLINGNLRLVLSVIQHFTGRGEDIDDLFQTGVVGLIKAINNFDLSKEDIDNLRVAILLYDIGNLMISPGLLQKATPLTDEEKDKIKNHPVIAAQEILKPISYVQDILPIIEHHHENWDGSGYPNKISKDEIPLTSQIILIIDEYFALIEPRPYRAKMSSRDALEVIKSDAGKKWNHTLVNEFISLIEHDIV